MGRGLSPLQKEILVAIYRLGGSEGMEYVPRKDVLELVFPCPTLSERVTFSNSLRSLVFKRRLVEAIAPAWMQVGGMYFPDCQDLSPTEPADRPWIGQAWYGWIGPRNKVPRIAGVRLVEDGMVVEMIEDDPDLDVSPVLASNERKREEDEWWRDSS